MSSELPLDRRERPTLMLAVLDAMFYAQNSVEPLRRRIEIGDFCRDIFERAGRGDESERERAKPVNATIAAAFVAALADYGFKIVPVAAVSGTTPTDKDDHEQH